MHSEREYDYRKHMACVSGLECTLVSSQPNPSVLAEDDNFYCKGCKNASCNYLNTLLYGCSEAFRWNGKYVYYCPEGFTFIASSLTDERCELTGGLVLGPFVMRIEDESDEQKSFSAEGLPVKNTVAVHHLEEVFSAVTESLCSVSHSFYGALAYEQEKQLAELYRMKESLPENDSNYDFLIKGERALRDMIAAQDKDGAQRHLNELLGYIYFTGEADMNIIKARLIELLVILSRAAIDAGAETGEILQFNENNITRVEKMCSLEELSVWITGIMHRFIRYSFDFTTVKHADILHKIIQYVKNNYRDKITLDDIASHVYLSRSYISSLFKEETGESLFSYINRIRVEKSKILLLNEDITLSDVGDFCGFDDQSYFTKVFKNMTGVSPKKYRDCRGKITLEKSVKE